MLAAQWWRYKLEDFEALDGEEQSRLIAVYRTQHQIEAVLNHAQAKEIERRQGKRGRR